MNRIKIIALAAGLTMFGTACSDLLDTNPRQSLTPEQTLDDIAGYRAVMNGMFRAAHRFNLYGQQLVIDPDILADNLTIQTNTGRFFGEWVNAAGSHVGIWGDSYDIINMANDLIADIDDLPGDADIKNEIKGQALFMRALMYHNLVKTYAYEPGREVGGFNQGVIIRLTPTRLASQADFRERSTNVEVYDQIETDLREAIALLRPVSQFTTAATRTTFATQAAAKALMSRVKLYRGDWSEAATYATQAMDEATANATTAGPRLASAAEYVTAFATVQHPESLFELDVRQADWSSVDGVNNSLASMTRSSGGGQYVVAGHQNLIDRYEEGDVRRNTWVLTSGGHMSQKWPAEKGNFLENIPVIRYSEVLLTRAEAYAQSNNSVGAYADINRLRGNRGLGELEAGLSGPALLDAILRERRLELALEGHRFYDLKRNGRDIPKPNAPGLDFVQYSDFRILAPIPFAQVELNPRLDQNPNY